MVVAVVRVRRCRSATTNRSKVVVYQSTHAARHLVCGDLGLLPCLVVSRRIRKIAVRSVRLSTPVRLGRLSWKLLCTSLRHSTSDESRFVVGVVLASIPGWPRAPSFLTRSLNFGANRYVSTSTVGLLVSRLLGTCDPSKEISRHNYDFFCGRHVTALVWSRSSRGY